MTDAAPIGAFWIYILAGVVTAILTATVVGVLVAAQRRQVEEARRFSQGLVEAQEAERARIARDLHDDVIQRVALIGGELSALARAIPSPTETVTQRVDGLREELHDLAEEVRGMARRAHPAILDHLGLVKAVQSLAAEMRISDDLTVDVVVDPNDPLEGIGHAAALSLYRVAQEGLRNVVRHSGAQRATIRLSRVDLGVALAIEDRGKGMDQATSGKGLGLLGISERIRAVQGQLTITSVPGEGTRLTAWVPSLGDQG